MVAITATSTALNMLPGQQPRREPQVGDDDADLAARDHPEPDGRGAPAADGPGADDASDGFRDHAEHDEGDDEGEDGWVGQRAEIELGAGEREEERREDLGERPHLVLELVLRLGLGDDEAGHERTDDRRQPDVRGDRGPART